MPLLLHLRISLPPAFYVFSVRSIFSSFAFVAIPDPVLLTLLCMPVQQHIVPAVLLLVALIHFIPLAGVLGSAKLSVLYGISLHDSNFEILMRHRAVLFGLLAAFLVHAAFHRNLHGLALIAAAFSVVSFLLLVLQTGHYNEAMASVFKVDVAAAILILMAVLVHAREPVLPPQCRDSKRA